MIYRKWVCSREGKRQEKWTTLDNRQREAKTITRVGCRIGMRIKYERISGVYLVNKFVKEHNYNMASQSCSLFLRSHRNVPDDDHALVQSMKRVGIKTSKIMKFFALQAGGYENVRFVAKDLYNNIDRDRRNVVIDGDAEGVLGYLRASQDALKVYHECTITEPFNTIHVPPVYQVCIINVPYKKVHILRVYHHCTIKYSTCTTYVPCMYHQW